MQLSLQYLDFERDGDQPMPRRRARRRPDMPTAADAADGIVRRWTRCGPWSRAASGCRSAIASSSRPARRPGQHPDGERRGGRHGRGLVSQLSDIDTARSPLWTERSLQRRFETVRTPFRADQGRAAKRLGGTLNTAFLTAAAEAARATTSSSARPSRRCGHRWRSAPAPSDSGANAFSLARMLVPTGEMPIAERFAARSRHRRRGPRSAPGSGVAGDAGRGRDGAADVADHPPRPPAGPDVDFATSNVRASPVPVYIAGAQLLENYPVGPLAGVAFNLTLLSYNGSLDMGINIDAAAVDRPGAAGRAASTAVVHRPAQGLKRRRRGSDLLEADRVRRRLVSDVEQHAHVEQEIGDLAGRHELAAHDLARAPDRSRRAPRRSRHRGTRRSDGVRVARSSTTPYPHHGRPARPFVTSVAVHGPVVTPLRRTLRAVGLRSARWISTDANVVVTGAARGIGAALARRFHAGGAERRRRRPRSTPSRRRRAGRASGRRDRRHRHRGRQRRADPRRRGGVRPDRPVLRQRRHRRRRPTSSRRPRTTGSSRSTSTSTPIAGPPSTCSPGGWPAARATSARRRRPPGCSPRSARRRTR